MTALNLNLPATTAGYRNGTRTPPESRQKGRTAITHDAIIDFLIARPGATHREVADAFGYSTTQAISIIVNSDAFQARYAARKGEVVDPLLTATVENRIQAVAAESARRLLEKLELTEDSNFILRSFEAAARAGGYGAQKQAPMVQNNFIAHLPGPAQSSDVWVKAVGGTVSPIIEAQTPPEHG